MSKQITVLRRLSLVFWLRFSQGQLGNLIIAIQLGELHRVFNRKFPKRLRVLNAFLAAATTSFRIIETPDEEVADEEKIREVKDRPLLRAAQIENIDILLTGDLDFLESGVERPMILNPTQFLGM